MISHKYQQLPLIPVGEFLDIHLEHTEDDEKTLMFARINHELSERELLEQERQGLLKKKQGLIADNKKRKDDLASLDKDLETFIDVSDLRIQVSPCEHVMLTPARLPNPYKRSSRSNTDLPSTIAPLLRGVAAFLGARLYFFRPRAGVPTEWRTIGIGGCDLRYPFHDSISLRVLMTVRKASLRLHVSQLEQKSPRSLVET